MEKRSVSWASPDGLSLLAQGGRTVLRILVAIALDGNPCVASADSSTAIQPVAEGEQLCEEWWL